MSFSQSEFKKGYYINNNGNKISGFIINYNYVKLPTKIEFKESLKSESRSIELDNIKEFEIENKIKFIKRTVELQQSSDKTKNLTNYRKPDLKSEEVFLKVIVKGDVSLYKYNHKGTDRYFIKYYDNDITPLIFKRFIKNQNNIQKNNQYIQDLSFRLNCETLTDKDFNITDYDEKDLSRLIVKFNECKKSNYKIYEKPKYLSFAVGVRAAMVNSSFELINIFRPEFSSDFGDEIDYRVGIELELSINKLKLNNFSLFTEPSYLSYEASAEIGESSESRNAKINTLQFPFGMRYYINFNDSDHKLFLNAAYIINNYLDSTEIELINDAVLRSSNRPISSSGFYGFGVGYTFKDKYRIEIRHETKRDILKSRLSTYSGNFESSFLITLGYNFLRF